MPNSAAAHNDPVMAAKPSRFAWVVLLLLSAPAALAQPLSCSNATLQGTYLYAISGVLNGEPYAETGRELYDGKGGVIVAYQSSDGSAGAQKGRYHVGADCIGKARYSDDEVYTTFVSPDGDRIVFTLMPVAGGEPSAISGTTWRVAR